MKKQKAKQKTGGLYGAEFAGKLTERRVLLSLPDSMYQQVKQKSVEQGVSASEFVRHALAFALTLTLTDASPAGLRSLAAADQAKRSSRGSSGSRS